MNLKTDSILIRCKKTDKIYPVTVIDFSYKEVQCYSLKDDKFIDFKFEDINFVIEYK